MTIEAYTIAPLKWEKDFSEERQQFRASVPMGSYTVSRTRKDWDENLPWESWKWAYCFDEYYDEGESDCDSAKDGKELAWKDWLNRIMPALKPVAVKQQPVEVKGGAA
jgi:hypothetical protein